MPNEGVHSPSASAKCSVCRAGGGGWGGGSLHNSVFGTAPENTHLSLRYSNSSCFFSRLSLSKTAARDDTCHKWKTGGMTAPPHTHTHTPPPSHTQPQPCDREQEADVPLSSSVASAVSESSWLSARPVQISCCRTASAMGITMAVVDVLLSHMERNTVQHMKPSTSLSGREGQGFMQGTDLTYHCGRGEDGERRAGR